jgi:hypothetical protein
LLYQLSYVGARERGKVAFGECAGKGEEVGKVEAFKR